MATTRTPSTLPKWGLSNLSSLPSCPPSSCYDYGAPPYPPGGSSLSYDPYGSSSSFMLKRRKRSFSANAKSIGKIDRNGRSSSYGYSYSKNDQCPDYYPDNFYGSSSYELNCPENLGSFSSFSDNSFSDSSLKVARTSPMGTFIYGQYVNYGCMDNYQSYDYDLEPSSEYYNNWQDSSIYTYSLNSNYLTGPPGSPPNNNYNPPILGAG